MCKNRRVCIDIDTQTALTLPDIMVEEADNSAGRRAFNSTFRIRVLVPDAAICAASQGILGLQERNRLG